MEWKASVVGFGDLSQICRRDSQGLGARAVTSPVEAVTWHARNLVLYDSQVLVVCPHETDSHKFENEGGQERRA
jgi:hypothetical protein